MIEKIASRRRATTESFARGGSEASRARNEPARRCDRSKRTLRKQRSNQSSRASPLGGVPERRRASAVRGTSAREPPTPRVAQGGINRSARRRAVCAASTRTNTGAYDNAHYVGDAAGVTPLFGGAPACPDGHNAASDDPSLFFDSSTREHSGYGESLRFVLGGYRTKQKGRLQAVGSSPST